MSEETQQELSPIQRVTNYLNDPLQHRKPPLGIVGAEWGKVLPKLSAAIVDALIGRRWPLVLVGPVGLGKSYAMACIYLAWREVEGTTVLWRNSGELLSRIIRCKMSGRDGVVVPRSDGGSFVEFEQTIYGKIEDAALLCLDDVGVKTPTESQREVFNNIIDLRAGKPTVITTNLDHAQFEKVFDDRTFSRVFSGTVIRTEAEDRRFEDAKVINVKDA